MSVPLPVFTCIRWFPTLYIRGKRRDEFVAVITSMANEAIMWYNEHKMTDIEYFSSYVADMIIDDSDEVTTNVVYSIHKRPVCQQR